MTFQRTERKKVRSVLDFGVMLVGSNPPMLTIEAYGNVPTPGWSEVKLEARLYAEFPPDGFQEFDLVGELPSEIQPEEDSEVYALFEWPNPPRTLKGIRIFAAEDESEYRFESPIESVAQDLA